MVHRIDIMVGSDKLRIVECRIMFLDIWMFMEVWFMV